MKVLIINAHPDPHSATSATNRVVKHLLDKLPAGSAEVVNLAEIDIQPINKTALDGFAAAMNQQQPTAEQSASLARLSATVAQLKSAPRLVLAYPFYNFSIPARLKDWLDNISIPGETFKYDKNGNPHGLMGTHKALILQGSGAVYSSGPMASMEHSVPYLKTLLGGFLGFADVDVVRAEGTQQQIIGLEAAVQKACADIDAKIDGFMKA